MKKTLALILAMLVAFSMFSVAAFAEEDLVTGSTEFMGKTFKSITLV